MSEGLLGGVKRKSSGMFGGQIKILNKEQLDMIDKAAKDVLWRTGVLMPYKEALDIMGKVRARMVNSVSNLFS